LPPSIGIIYRASILPYPICGRYTLTVDKSTIEKRFAAKFYIAEASYDWEPTHNANALYRLFGITTVGASSTYLQNASSLN
jgi:hypothetical protein